MKELRSSIPMICKLIDLKGLNKVQWLIFVISATWEAYVGGLQSTAGLSEEVWDYLKNN
jgi:hypothetical protein